MATIEQFQERLRRAARESLQKCLAEGDLPEAQAGEAWFTTIETLALAAGDAVSLEVFEQQLAECGLGPPRWSPRRWDIYGTSSRGCVTPNTANKDCRLQVPMWNPP